MALIALDGFKTKLTDPISRSDTALMIPPNAYAYIEDKLKNNGDYTYLSLTNKAGAYEIIKIENVSGDLAVIRGQGETEAIVASTGDCLVFEMNSLVVADIAGNGVDPAVCEIKVAEDTPLTLEKDGCIHTIGFEWPTCDEIDFMGAKFKIENGCIVIEDEDCNCSVLDGTYSNATVTIKDGRICSIQNGQNPQYVLPSCSCCGCSTGDCNCNNTE